MPVQRHTVIVKLTCVKVNTKLWSKMTNVARKCMFQYLHGCSIALVPYKLAVSNDNLPLPVQAREIIFSLIVSNINSPTNLVCMIVVKNGISNVENTDMSVTFTLCI